MGDTGSPACAALGRNCPAFRAVMLQQRVGFSRCQLALIVPSLEQHGAIADDSELDPARRGMTPQRGIQAVVVLPHTPEMFIRRWVAEHCGSLLDPGDPVA